MKTLEKLEKATIDRETEKAVFVETRFGDEFDAKVWLPKSQIEIDEDGSVWVPAWLIDAKSKDVCDFKCTPHLVLIATVRGEIRNAA